MRQRPELPRRAWNGCRLEHELDLLTHFKRTEEGAGSEI